MYRYFVIDDLFKINEDIKNKGAFEVDNGQKFSVYDSVNIGRMKKEDFSGAIYKGRFYEIGNPFYESILEDLKIYKFKAIRATF